MAAAVREAAAPSAIECRGCEPTIILDGHSIQTGELVLRWLLPRKAGSKRFAMMVINFANFEEVYEQKAKAEALRLFAGS